MEKSAGKFAGAMEIFVPTNGHAADLAADQSQAVQKFHSRLASPEFAEQMTGVFFDAKRAALASSK